MAAIISIHWLLRSLVRSFIRPPCRALALARKFICGNSVLLNYIGRSLARSSSVRFIPSVQFSIDFGIDIVTRRRDGQTRGRACGRTDSERRARRAALQAAAAVFILCPRSFGGSDGGGSCCIQGFPQSKRRAEITLHDGRRRRSASEGERFGGAFV